jgi:hypothetical protein
VVWSGWSAEWLVVAGEVDGEFSEEFAGGGVDDADLEVLGEQQDVGSGVGSSVGDVSQSAGDAQGDGAGLVEPVLADPVVGLGCWLPGGGSFGAGVVDGRWGGPVR